MTKGINHNRTVSAVTLGIDCAHCLDRSHSQLAKFQLRTSKHIQRVAHRPYSSWVEVVGDASMLVHVREGSHALHEVVDNSAGVQTNCMHLEELQAKTANPYEVALSYVESEMGLPRHPSS